MLKRWLQTLRETAAYKLAVFDCIEEMSLTRPKESMACSDWFDARDELITAVRRVKPARHPQQQSDHF